MREQRHLSIRSCLVWKTHACLQNLAADILSFIIFFWRGCSMFLMLCLRIYGICTVILPFSTSFPFRCKFWQVIAVIIGCTMVFISLETQKENTHNIAEVPFEFPSLWLLTWIMIDNPLLLSPIEICSASCEVVTRPGINFLLQVLSDIIEEVLIGSQSPEGNQNGRTSWDLEMRTPLGFGCPLYSLGPDQKKKPQKLQTMLLR